VFIDTVELGFLGCVGKLALLDLFSYVSVD
jgi:hypothetical protein